MFFQSLLEIEKAFTKIIIIIISILNLPNLFFFLLTFLTFILLQMISQGFQKTQLNSISKFFGLKGSENLFFYFLPFLWSWFRFLFLIFLEKRKWINFVLIFHLYKLQNHLQMLFIVEGRGRRKCSISSWIIEISSIDFLKLFVYLSLICLYFSAKIPLPLNIWKQFNSIQFMTHFQPWFYSTFT